MAKIKITLSTGRKVTLKQPDILEDCDKDKEVTLVFNNGEMFTGFFVKLDNGEDDDIVILKKNGSMFNAGFPYNRLIGWFYS